MEIRPIQSAQNPRVAYIKKLQKSVQLRRQDRCAIIEGFRCLETVFAGRPGCIKQVYCTPAAENRVRELGLFRSAAIEFFSVSERLFACFSAMKSPQGVLALAGWEPESEISEINYPALLLDNLGDPGNLGTILRSAAAFGFPTVLLFGHCADVYSSKVIQSSMGSAFFLHLRAISQERLGQLADQGAGILASEPAAGAKLVDFSFPEKTIVCIGREGEGLSAPIREMAGAVLRIPMRDGIDSLNAAVAASIIMYAYFAGSGC